MQSSDIWAFGTSAFGVGVLVARRPEVTKHTEDAGISLALAMVRRHTRLVAGSLHSNERAL